MRRDRSAGDMGGGGTEGQDSPGAGAAAFLHVTSAHNPRFKLAAKLRERRERDRQARILIDGRREIDLAIEAGLRVEEVFVDESWTGQPDLAPWLQQRLAEGTQVVTLPARLMAKLGYGDRQDQVVATARRPARSLNELSLPPEPLVVVLEGLEKPGNVGALLRSADAAGLDAVIVADGGTDLFNPNAIRASRGTIFTVPLCAAAAADVARWLDQHRLQVYVARVDATRCYDTCDFRRGTAIVLGSEARGVSAIWCDNRYQGIRLPMAGHADSLNVAVTGAILFYEALRQRRC